MTTLILFFLFMAGSLGAQTAITPDSCEYKLLLKPELFVNPAEGSVNFWKLVTKAAEKQGLQYERTDEVLDNRDICFLDTSDFQLHNRGLILRCRGLAITNAEQLQTLQPGEDFELTLKLRIPKLQSATATSSFATSFAHDEDLEEDIAMTASGPVSFYSRSCEIEDARVPPDTISTLTGLFPDLAAAGLPASASLKLVNNLLIRECRLEKGLITFENKEAKAMFSLWYNRADNKLPIAAEFSFKVKLGKSPEKAALRRQQADSFFAELISEAKDSIAADQTKTGLVYQYQP